MTICAARNDAVTVTRHLLKITFKEHDKTCKETQASSPKALICTIESFARFPLAPQQIGANYFEYVQFMFIKHFRM